MLGSPLFRQHTADAVCIPRRAEEAAHQAADLPQLRAQLAGLQAALDTQVQAAAGAAARATAAEAELDTLRAALVRQPYGEAEVGWALNCLLSAASRVLGVEDTRRLCRLLGFASALAVGCSHDKHSIRHPSAPTASQERASQDARLQERREQQAVALRRALEEQEQQQRSQEAEMKVLRMQVRGNMSRALGGCKRTQWSCLMPVIMSRGVSTMSH